MLFMLIDKIHNCTKLYKIKCRFQLKLTPLSPWFNEMMYFRNTKHENVTNRKDKATHLIMMTHIER